MIKLLLIYSFIISCHEQNKTSTETITAKAGPAAAQEDSSNSIKISPAQLTLDFSSTNSHFDSVYGSVHSGFRDKAGNTWFGTTGAGAVRYDGRLFTRFSTKDRQGNNSVIPLLEDKAGNIWFASADGLYRYNGKIFTHIQVVAAENNNAQSFSINSLPNKSTTAIDVIAAIQDSKGNIWFSTALNGVYCYNGTTFTHIVSKAGIINNSALRLNSIINMLEDQQGNIWFASWNNEGLCCYDGKSLQSFNPKNGLGDDMIYSILEGKTGLWIGTRNHGVWIYDGKSFTNFTAGSALQNESIYSIALDKMGNCWFATQSKGLWFYNVELGRNNKTSGRTFINFTTKNGLSNTSVFCIVPESSGNILFGTRGMGLCRYDGKIFTSLTVKRY